MPEVRIEGPSPSKLASSVTRGRSRRSLSPPADLGVAPRKNQGGRPIVTPRRCVQNPRVATDPSNGSIDPYRSRVGVAFTPFETRTDVIGRLAMKADDLCLARVDVAEGWTHDALLLVADLALLTSRVELGTSVISAWGRTPATMALAASSLQRYSCGRFSLGIGASSPPLTEGLHGIKWDRPVARLRETLTSLRALLAGARLPNPVPDAHPLRLGVVPEVPVPIVLAALSPASIRLAGELADGWAPFLWSRSRIDEGRTLLREGEERADAPTPTRVSIGVPTALGPDADAARRLAAWWLSTYTTRMGPLYRRMLSERFGMAGAVGEIVEAARRDQGEQLPAAAERAGRRGHADGNIRASERTDQVLVRGRRRHASARAPAGAPGTRALRDPRGRGRRHRASAAAGRSISRRSRSAAIGGFRLIRARRVDELPDR